MLSGESGKKKIGVGIGLLMERGFQKGGGSWFRCVMGRLCCRSWVYLENRRLQSLDVLRYWIRRLRILLLLRRGGG